MPSNCNECEKDTPSKIYICHPCQNDEDFADYRTEWEIWEEKMYWEDVERIEKDEQKRYTPQFNYQEVYNMQREGYLIALHGLTGN